MWPMIPVTVACIQLGMTPARVRVLCRERRIKGAKMLGRLWYLPDNFKIEPRSMGPPLLSKPKR